MRHPAADLVFVNADSRRMTGPGDFEVIEVTVADLKALFRFEKFAVFFEQVCLAHAVRARQDFKRAL